MIITDQITENIKQELLKEHKQFVDKEVITLLKNELNPNKISDEEAKRITKLVIETTKSF